MANLPLSGLLVSLPFAPVSRLCVCFAHGPVHRYRGTCRAWACPPGTTPLCVPIPAQPCYVGVQHNTSAIDYRPSFRGRARDPFVLRRLCVFKAVFCPYCVVASVAKPWACEGIRSSRMTCCASTATPTCCLRRLAGRECTSRIWRRGSWRSAQPSVSNSAMGQKRRRGCS